MMRSVKFILLALTAMALVPGAALATHLTDVVVEADCEGWWAQVDVYWRSGIYTGNLDYAISLLDQNANVLEQIVWAGPISRAVGDPQAMSYVFTGDWTGLFPGPLFTVTGMFHIVAPWPGGVDDETANYSATFECTVATEASTWSTIKALYN